jgi:hypothetical protein
VCFSVLFLDFNKKPSTQSRSIKKRNKNRRVQKQQKIYSRQKKDDDKIGQMAIQDMKYGNGLCITMFPLKNTRPLK